LLEEAVVKLKLTVIAGPEDRYPDALAFRKELKRFA
jgi:hypothetical protein